MEGTAQIGSGRRVLEHIVMMLLALADLAERAASAPDPIRRVVLQALQEADAIVKDFVVDFAGGMARRQWSPAVMTVRYGSTAEDAFDLATSLRILALAVRTLATLFGRRPDAREQRISDERGVPRLHGVVRPAKAVWATKLEPADTS